MTDPDVRIMWQRISLVAAALLIARLSGVVADPAAYGAAPPLRAEMLVTTDWLAHHLDDPGIVIVHVTKSRTGYDKEHIVGARLLLWDEIVTTRDGVPNELPPAEQLTEVMRRLGIAAESRVILYDEETGLSAARAYVTLDYLGLAERTSLLDGQWKRWRTEGRPVAAEAPAVKPSAFVPRLHPPVIVPLRIMEDLVWVKRQASGSGAIIIDARPPEQYSGTEPGEGVQRPGYIPGAAGVFWMQNIAKADDPVLRPIEELRTLYAAAGVKAGTPLIVYCRTGVQAAQTYFTLRYLGYDPQLYDGSFIEWSAQSRLPVESGR